MSFVRIALALALCSAVPVAAQSPEHKDNIAGPYVPTPRVIVDEMLKLADIRADDVVYDLGSGDGRLVIEAAARFGSRGVHRAAARPDRARERRREEGRGRRPGE